METVRKEGFWKVKKKKDEQDRKFGMKKYLDIELETGKKDKVKVLESKVRPTGLRNRLHYW